MGAGSMEGQYDRRFDEGDPIEGEPINECEPEKEKSELVKAFREYEVYRAENWDYELFKGDEEIGWFAKEMAEVEEDMVIFELNHDMKLEVSKRGARTIMTPEKAELCGLIASDGGLGIYWKYNEERGYYQSSYKADFSSMDKELIETFDNLVEEVYHETPHNYETKDGLTRAYVFDRRVYFDLADIGAKTGPFKFHVPREHLDEEGKRKYLRGFFSGDGEVSREAHGYVIQFQSTCKEGIEEIHETLEGLGFHPHPIHARYYEKDWSPTYRFTIPSAEHIRFIEEIGSDKPSHQEIFEEIKQYRESIRQYKLREHEGSRPRKHEDE